MLSSDVSAGFDPTYASAFEAKNASLPGPRPRLQQVHRRAAASAAPTTPTPSTWPRSAASWTRAASRFQTAELGRVDVGGGGTIAYILALYGMNVIDCGVPVLSMHSPWEITSKADIYEAYRGYCSFLRLA